MYSHSKKTQLFKCNQFMVTSSTCSYIPTQTVAHLDTLWQVRIVQPYSHTRTTCKYFKTASQTITVLDSMSKTNPWFILPQICTNNSRIDTFVSDHTIHTNVNLTLKSVAKYRTQQSKTINSSQNNDKETVIFFGLYLRLKMRIFQ